MHLPRVPYTQHPTLHNSSILGQGQPLPRKGIVRTVEYPIRDLNFSLNFLDKLFGLNGSGEAGLGWVWAEMYRRQRGHAGEGPRVHARVDSNSYFAT